MMSHASASAGTRVWRATLVRELRSYRINRFLHVHGGLMLGIGLLALIAPPEAAASGATWWALNGVLYVASLSALLLGLSSAHAEREEMALLFAQPIRLSGWVLGKAAGAAVVVVPAAALLFLPSAFAGGGVGAVVVGAAGAAAGVSLLWAWMGLALGLLVGEPVRGLIAALLVWFALLFVADLALLLLSGSPWVRERPGWWVAALMLSPLDTYRITLLFWFEGAAFSGGTLHPLARWWLAHPGLWLACCLSLWGGFALGLARLGAERRRRSA